jgi:hypothetical protein
MTEKELTSNGSAPVMNTDLAEVLSPSQVRCFMDCQTRWWFKYGLKYPDPPTGSLALGRAVHASLGHNFAQKVETHEDLPTAGVLALFREVWAVEREQTELRDDESPKELAATGETLILKYMDEVAPGDRAGRGRASRRGRNRWRQGAGLD